MSDEKFHLESILSQLASGELKVYEAKKVIENHFESHFMSNEQNTAEKCSSLKTTVNRFKNIFPLDSMIKKSSRLISQLSEHLPQKIQDKLGHIDFSVHSDGVSSKLSIFKEVDVGQDNILTSNHVTGCQWFGITLSGSSQIKNNQFIAMQISEFTLESTDFCDSYFSFSRINRASFHQSCFHRNKFILTSWIASTLRESDITDCIFNRAEFIETTLAASRLTKIHSIQVGFKNCQIKNSEIQGIIFENCEFKECIFLNLKVVSEELVKISGFKVSQKTIENCSSVDEFMEQLEKIKEI